MAKRKKGRAQHSTQALQTSISRELERGDFKEALKNARVAFRKDASPGNRLLLQRACLARAEQLHQNGLLEQARDALRELSDLGPPPEDLQAKTKRLAILLGLPASNGAATADDLLSDDPKLLAELADQAVLQGTAPALPANLRQQAEQVRNVLRLIETNQADSDTLALPAIDRRSPLADWKLFARGLAAYYAGEDQRALANWGRLDADRPPHRIAQAFLVAAGLVREKDASDETRARAKRLAATAENGGLDSDLRTFRRHWEDGDWGLLLRSYSRIASRYRDSHAEIVHKLGELLSRRIIKEERHSDVRRLPKSYIGPPLDPKFNRVKALLAEMEDEWFAARQAWLSFLDDLQRSPLLQDRERSIAIGLVYQRVAADTCHLAEDYSEDFWPPRDRETELVQRQLIDEATDFFEKSLQHAPALRDTYLMYTETLKEFGEHPKKIERVYRRLIEQFPDDAEVQLFVAQHFLDEEQPATAKKYARAAERLQPRDDRVRAMLWTASVATARMAARRKEFGVARAELSEAEPLCAPGRDRYVLDAYRAAIEFKAGNADRAEEFLQTALGHFDQPAVGLLIVSAQAFRVGVSRDVRKELNARLKEELDKAKKTSQTAGAMARFFNALERTNTTYHGFRTHSQMVTRFLKACKRVRWEVEDLIAVCEFLSNEEDRVEAFTRLAKQGLKRFPEEPYFQFVAGHIEMMDGPLHCNRAKARAAFERAIELSKTADRPLDEAQRTRASHALDLLQEPPPFMTDFDFFDSDDEYDDEDEDEDEFFADGGPSQVDLDELIASLPPEARRELDKLKRRAGPQVMEILREMLAREMQAYAEEEKDEGPPARSPQRRGKRRKPAR